jgi:PAS domain S-box-containing protein
MYLQMIENMNDIFWEVDLDFSIQYISSGIKKATGFSPTDMLGKNLEEFIEPSVFNQLKSLFLQWLENFNSTGEYNGELFEHYQLCKNGDYKWFEALTNPILDKSNKLIGIQGLSRDISSWKKANEALRDSEERLSKVFHSSPVVITLIRISDNKILSPLRKRSFWRFVKF